MAKLYNLSKLEKIKSGDLQFIFIYTYKVSWTYLKENSLLFYILFQVNLQ